MATSPIRVTHPRNYPAWEFLEPAETGTAGVRVTAWVSKSGKTGIGVTIAATNCGDKKVQVGISKAAFWVEGVPRPVIADHPAPKSLERTQVNYHYLAFSFDNESLWNQGQRSGKLQLVLRIGEATVPWSLSAKHLLRSFHKEVRSPFFGKKKKRHCNDNKSEQQLCPGKPGILQMRGGQQ
jgi:hypothetical protein